jgi:membrane protease YdiL (CAAX protease family)
MTNHAAASPSFWTTVRLLLAVSRKRAFGRLARQRALLSQRGAKGSVGWSRVGFAFVVVLAAALNLGAGCELLLTISAAERAQASAEGTIVVGDWFIAAVADLKKQAKQDPSRQAGINQALISDIHAEAARQAKAYGADEKAIDARLTTAFQNKPKSPREKLVAASKLGALRLKGALPDMLGLFVLLFWCGMLVCQGDGPELDTQRQRHPMWEWLFSHPAPPGAIFLAEMISPIAANPFYLTAPLFPGLLFGWIYGWIDGVAAAALVGIPAAVALACIGKAIEINVLLRFSPRVRGAVLGLMGWYGYTSMMLFLFAAASLEKIVALSSGLLLPLAALPWPRLPILVGVRADGSASFLLGVLVCWLVAGVLSAGAVGFSVWSARRGLAGSFVHAVSAPIAAENRRSRFGREPLYRKELLWFRRDGSAIVQVVLVPLSIAAFQLFNMRVFVSEAQGAWNYLCGAGILFGTYFLLILGPKSLASEGQALWIALTWPRGLESLLKAKARLWALIASAIVAVVLLYSAYQFPENLWKIALVGIGWFVFARSLAEKTVTLANVTSASGEPQKIPSGQRWAVSLGTLTFAIGVLTQQWSLAIAGIVYSIMTAAALWQNFRFRLPYLYDPWSEVLPPAPTLMHAMIAISAMVEGASVLSVGALWWLGRDNLAVASALIYASCAVVASLGMAKFLEGRGVPQSEVFVWRQPRPWFGAGIAPLRRAALAVGMGAALGLALGLCAHGYLALLHYLPFTSDIMVASDKLMDATPHTRVSYFVIAVLFAPFAEEYLFRGLLYRALDREWGGWRAVLGSAAFFAVYHPALSWLPVAAVGAANAMLYKKTGYLAPAIALHLVYNAVVLS